MTQEKLEKKQNLPEKNKIVSADVIHCPPQTHQKIQRIIGLSDSTQLGNKMWYDLACFNVYKEFLGEDYVRAELKKEGKDWEKIKSEIKKIGKILAELKPTWDLIQDKKWSKIDKEKELKQRFIKLASKLPIVDDPILKILTWITNKTDMPRFTVPNECYKSLDMVEYKPFIAPKKPYPSSSEGSSGVAQ